MEHTLDVLQLDEIQHGVAAASSARLMKRLQCQQIRLNICPSSNLSLGVVEDVSTHSIRILVNGILPPISWATCWR